MTMAFFFFFLNKRTRKGKTMVVRGNFIGIIIAVIQMGWVTALCVSETFWKALDIRTEFQ